MEGAISVVFVLIAVFSSLIRAANRKNAQKTPNTAPRPTGWNHEEKLAPTETAAVKPSALRTGKEPINQYSGVRSEPSAMKSALRSKSKLDARDLRRAVILSEVLSKPISIRNEE